MKLYVVYSTDDNYAQHVGISMVSLFENNKYLDSIDINLIDNNISEINKKKLKSICESYQRTIKFIPFEKFNIKLKLNMSYHIALSSYARLFISSIVDNSIDKVLYLDSDSIISSNLSELWETDISSYYVAGVEDTASSSTKVKVGLKPDQPYINAGMLLINLKMWREHDIENQFIKFIEKFNGNVFHHDQGTINGVLNNKILLLHPKYNVMTTFFTMQRKNMIQYYGLKRYYSETELREAINYPVFIHFTPAFVNRPWIKGCKHPQVETYLRYLKMTPWKDERLLKDNRRFVERFIAFLYNHLSFNTANKISNLIFR